MVDKDETTVIYTVYTVYTHLGIFEGVSRVNYSTKYTTVPKRDGRAADRPASRIQLLSCLFVPLHCVRAGGGRRINSYFEKRV